jgi:AbrB family looped-hinge helix DNA binding protein
MSSSTHVTVTDGGQVVIPAHIRSQLGLRGGDRLIARLVDGAIVLETVDAAVRRAQALVARYVSQDISLSDELIAERRAIADNE